MKSSFYTVDIDTHDMALDQVPIDDIVAVTKFQTSIKCGASIESLKLVDFDQHVEDGEILTMMYVIAVVNNEEFKVLYSTTNQDHVKNLLTFGGNSKARQDVMDHILNLLS